MKKKIIALILSLFLILPSSFAFAGCFGGDPGDGEPGVVDPSGSDDSGAGDGSGDGEVDSGPKMEDINPEFAEFSDTVTKIMSNYDLSSLKGDSGDGDAQIASMSLGLARSTEKTLEERVYDAVVGAGEEKRDVVSNVSEYYADMIEQAFVTPLGCGDALALKYGANTFYGIKTKVIYDDPNGKCYFEVTKSADSGSFHIDIYTGYNYEDELREYFSYANIDFVSEDDYTVEMVSFDPDFNEFYYACADADYKFTMLSRYVEQDIEKSKGYISWDLLTARSILSCYETQDGELVEPFYDEYIEKIDNDIDIEKYMADIRAGYESATHSVTEDEMQEAFANYVDESANSESSLMEMIPYHVEDGILRIYNVDDYEPKGEDGSDILPTNAYAIEETLYIPKSVKKLIIPTSITKIKCRKGDLLKDYYDNLTDEELEKKQAEYDEFMEHYYDLEYYNTYYTEMVDATPEYIMKRFEIIADDEEGNRRTDFDIEIAEGSTLFEKINGNIYVKMDDVKILVYMGNASALINGLGTIKIEFDDTIRLSFIQYIIDSIATNGNMLITDSITRQIYEMELDKQVKNLEITCTGGFDFGVWLDWENTYSFDSIKVTFTREQVVEDVGEDLPAPIEYDSLMFSRNITSIGSLEINGNNGVSIGLYTSDDDSTVLKGLTLGEDIIAFDISGAWILDFDRLSLNDKCRTLSFGYQNDGGATTTGDFAIDMNNAQVQLSEWRSENAPKQIYVSELKTSVSYYDMIYTHSLPTVPTGSKLNIYAEKYTLANLRSALYLKWNNNNDYDKAAYSFATILLNCKSGKYSNIALHTKWSTLLDNTITQDEENDNQYNVKIASTTTAIDFSNYIYASYDSTWVVTKNGTAITDLKNCPISKGGNEFTITITDKNNSKNTVTYNLNVYKKDSYTVTFDVQVGDFTMDAITIDEGDTLEFTLTRGWTIRGEVDDNLGFYLKSESGGLGHLEYAPKSNNNSYEYTYQVSGIEKDTTIVVKAQLDKYSLCFYAIVPPNYSNHVSDYNWPEMITIRSESIKDFQDSVKFDGYICKGFYADKRLTTPLEEIVFDDAYGNVSIYVEVEPIVWSVRFDVADNLTKIDDWEPYDTFTYMGGDNNYILNDVCYTPNEELAHYSVKYFADADCKHELSNYLTKEYVKTYWSDTDEIIIYVRYTPVKYRISISSLGYYDAGGIGNKYSGQIETRDETKVKYDDDMDEYYIEYTILDSIENISKLITVKMLIGSEYSLFVEWRYSWVDYNDCCFNESLVGTEFTALAEGSYGNFGIKAIFKVNVEDDD